MIDNIVSLVHASLRVNGYFTVTDFTLEILRSDGHAPREPAFQSPALGH